MNLNDRKVEEQTVDPYAILKEGTDGFIVVGYLKGSHDKFAQFYSTDRACNDALGFFHGPVNEWMNMMKSQCLQEADDDS
jgi:hypothetical protein